eukprot:scaffold141526_cov18-Prasinocladus_malaysianus.AAC.1
MTHSTLVHLTAPERVTLFLTCPCDWIVTLDIATACHYRNTTGDFLALNCNVSMVCQENPRSSNTAMLHSKKKFQEIIKKFQHYAAAFRDATQHVL